MTRLHHLGSFPRVPMAMWQPLSIIVVVGLFSPSSNVRNLGGWSGGGGRRQRWTVKLPVVTNQVKELKLKFEQSTNTYHVIIVCFCVATRKHAFNEQTCGAIFFIRLFTCMLVQAWRAKLIIVIFFCFFYRYVFFYDLTCTEQSGSGNDEATATEPLRRTQK